MDRHRTNLGWRHGPDALGDQPQLVLGHVGGPDYRPVFVATANSADDDTWSTLDGIVVGLIGKCTGEMSCGPSYWSYGVGGDLRGWLNARD